MKLLLISNFSDIPNEHYVLNLLFCEGLRYFHLRKRDYTIHQMANYIEQIAEPFRQYVVLHSHFELINEYGLKGAHFTKKFGYDDYLLSRKLPSDSPLAFEHLSFSLHSIPEIKRMPVFYDYLFLSPVFDSISNQGYNSKFRTQELKSFLTQKTNRPEVIALGGITDEVVTSVFDTGFDGMALLGYIWTTFERTQDIVQAVKRFKTIKNLIRTREEATALSLAASRE
ncbi:thiamine-phosphate pyrophosphorylase [Fibrisoma limi BUZ 3]|uniref:Thiamine-phosphate pyrophosphorylase n=1 Tax=Fibrisoma limi BUZ 3 TaxID=1185876 RepID=I2GCE5_9BACT|nr:thiamine phosphate synthase [Fibrisoma limi]CCH51569.1 thiamine-phosphate pyrophosphorylase [Fibrisoma limi BUZ 3]